MATVKTGRSGTGAKAADAPKTGFTGWPPGVYEFFDGLEEDNSREWFQAHRDAYERDVRGPMERFLAHAVREIGGESHLFRVNRDVRFSKDKRPYKEHIGAVVHQPGGAIQYVQVDGGGLFVGSGYYHMAPDQIARYRVAVAGEDGADFATVLAAVHRAGLASGEPQLQRVPRPYDKDHPRADLLRYKSVIVHRRWDQPAWLHTAKAGAEVLKAWKTADPFNAWLVRFVGPTQMPPPSPPGGR
jgi:uncharacterized protein (TIGR02453 family)